MTIFNHYRDIVGMVPLVSMGFVHVRPITGLGKKGLPSIKYHYPQAYEAEL
jgi:hypothetical protein